MEDNLNLPFYAEGIAYPFTNDLAIKNNVFTSANLGGFTTAILGLFHIGRNTIPGQNNGDIIFNNVLVIANGQYVGNPNWPAFVNNIIAKSVTTVCASIGGGYPVIDFTTIKNIYNENGQSFKGTNLENNLILFKKLFPSVSIIDMDCEDCYDSPSFIAFCQMVASIGFKITFCPYTNQHFWVNALAALEHTNPGAVLWFNLQCYAGGTGNNPATWAQTIKMVIPSFNTDKFIIPGAGATSAPQEVQSLMSTFSEDASVGGGFIWTLDIMVNNNPNNPYQAIKQYSEAITNGLAGTTASVPLEESSIAK